MALIEYVDNDQQKKAFISKSTAPMLLKLGGGLDHKYTKAWNFLDPAL